MSICLSVCLSSFLSFFCIIIEISRAPSRPYISHQKTPLIHSPFAQELPPLMTLSPPTPALFRAIQKRQQHQCPCECMLMPVCGQRAMIRPRKRRMRMRKMMMRRRRTLCLRRDLSLPPICIPTLRQTHRLKSSPEYQETVFAPSSPPQLPPLLLLLLPASHPRACSPCTPLLCSCHDWVYASSAVTVSPHMI